MKKDSIPNNIDFKAMITSDFSSFKGSSERIKKNIIQNQKFNNYFDNKQKVKKSFIIPFLELIPSNLVKIAAVGFIFLASYTSLKISVQQPGFHIEGSQIVDTSFNGFDTCLVNSRNINFR